MTFGYLRSITYESAPRYRASCRTPTPIPRYRFVADCASSQTRRETPQELQTSTCSIWDLLSS